MRKLHFWSILMLGAMALGVSSCGNDDDDKPDRTVTLTSDDLTENGYFDGFLYYKVTSNSPMEVAVAAAEKSIVNIEIPSIVKIDGANYRCTSIGNEAFKGCANLHSAQIPKGVIVIGNHAFVACKNLASVSIPESVTSIGKSAFESCTTLPSVTIPEGVVSIGEYAFESCDALTSITIPKSATNIQQNAFADCPALVSMKVTEGNAKYDSRDNCNAIIETASNTLCHGCQTSFIPTTVTAIGAYAFRYCTALKSISIPSNVKVIGECAFVFCDKLASVDLAVGVTRIESQAFAQCTAMTAVEIPLSVTFIGSHAFSNKYLTTVRCLSPIPCSTDAPFDTETYNAGRLMGPYGAASAYRNASYWKYFKTIIEN